MRTYFVRGATAIFAGVVTSSIANAQFLPPNAYATNASPGALAAGDLTGDGRPDVVVSCATSPQSLKVMFNNGDGTFAAFFQLGHTVLSPVDIELGDLNGDGFLDIVMADPGISRLLGSGTAIFSALATTPLGSPANSIELADVNGDNNLDVIMIRPNDAAVLIGKGDGSFNLPELVTNLYGSYQSVASEDLDLDGDIDFATVDTNNNIVKVLAGANDGTFTVAAVGTVGTNPGSLEIGDLDADGDGDLAVANFASHDVSVLLGDGAGGIAPQTKYAGINSPTHPVIGDFDVDGLVDIAAVNSFSPNVSFFKGTGSGNFNNQLLFPTNGYPTYDAAGGDFDGNGVPDLATSNAGTNNVSIILASASSCGPVTQSQQIVRVGNPANPNVFLPGLTPPKVGATWNPKISHATFMPLAVVDLMLISPGQANQVVWPHGTLLCDLTGPNIQVSTLASTPFAIPIPVICSLVGLSLCCQGASTSISATKLTNALDIVIGTY